MPYTYGTSVNPFAQDIGQFIVRGGDLAAARAERLAAVQARAQEQAGQIWGRTLGSIGDTIAGTIQRATDPRRQMEAMTLQHAKDLQAGEQQLDDLVRPFTPSGPADGGGNLPAEHPFLDDHGLYDIPKLTEALSASAKAHLAPELLKGAEQINASITSHQASVEQLKAAQQKTADAQTVLYGDMADGVSRMVKAGMPFDQALDLASAPALATKRIDPQQFAGLRAKLVALPPDQQQTVLGNLMDAAAQISPEKDLAEGAKRLDRYNRPTATNPKNEKPTEASLAADAATLGTPQETPTARQSAAALAKLKPPPPRSESEQAMDAYAKSIGKTRSEELTDADRQAYIKRDAEQKAAAAFAQHKQERTYDVANPVPVKGKSQDELEQEARGVLQREFSSRSGGLGQEDGKVDQAIHLVALMDQYDGKNMPAQIQAELALGLARLTSPNGQVGVELEKEFHQKTAQEGIAKGIAYLTGDPQLVNATPEKLRDMLRDSITRQGSVAQQNRQTYLDAMLSMLPTTLEKSRRDAIAQGTKLNRMPAPKGAPAVGTTRDGATWKDGPQGWGWYR
jgi:hypothetical protein